MKSAANATVSGATYVGEKFTEVGGTEYVKSAASATATGASYVGEKAVWLGSGASSYMSSMIWGSGE